jgi:hypothetical protein
MPLSPSGRFGTHEALLTLLELVANEKLNPGERKLALQQSEKLIKYNRAGHRHQAARGRGACPRAIFSVDF